MSFNMKAWLFSLFCFVLGYFSGRFDQRWKDSKKKNDQIKPHEDDRK